MKFWQSLAFVEMEQIFDVARLAEQLGFYGVSYGEHLVTTKDQVDRYLYADDGQVVWRPDTPWPDPLVLTAALAQVTTRLRFLTTVYLLPLRDPFSAAKAISTAAVLSGHRLALGVGTGWQKAEFDLVGREFRRRGRRLDEQLDVIAKLMTGAMVEHHGAHYEFPPLQMAPGTATPVPIYVAGESAAALERAARHDGWMGRLYEERAIPPLVEAVRRARREAGSDARPFEIWVAVRDPAPDTFARLAALGVTMVNGASFMVGGKAARSSLDDKRRILEEFAGRFLR